MSPQFIYSRSGALKPGPGPDEFSILMDGGAFRNNTAQLLGIANAWSVSIWANSNDIDITHGLLFLTKATGVRSIDITHDGSASSGRLIANCAGEFTGTIKRLSWDGVFTLDTWVHLVLTWDGTDLLLYIDSVDTAFDLEIIDSPNTMTDFNRRTNYGSNSNASTTFRGHLGPLAIWDVTLAGAAITEIFNGKFGIDLRNDTGNYSSSVDLQHYYRVGFNQVVGFTDLGSASNLIDLDNSFSIDETNIERNFPI